MNIDEYRKAYQKEYREKHREKNKAYFKEWQEKNKDRVKEYYQRNAEKIRANRRQRYREDPEYFKEAYTRWAENEPLEKKQARGQKHVDRLRERYANDPDYKAKLSQYQREWRKKFRQEHPELMPGKDRRDKLRRDYDMTLEEYDALYEAQKGCCAICNKFHEKGRGRKNLVVDHCHKTNQVRGLLCSNCNTAIGLMHDRIDLFESAIKYLSKL